MNESKKKEGKESRGHLKRHENMEDLGNQEEL